MMRNIYVLFLIISILIVGCETNVEYKPDKVIARLESKNRQDIKGKKETATESDKDTKSIYSEIQPTEDTFLPQKAKIPSGAVDNINFGKYHALVIGINNYPYMQNLQTAKNDARSVAYVLKKEYGFSVNLLIDPGRVDIISALNELRNKLTSEDNLLIYYAGHGWLDKEANEGYWLPSDAKKDNEANWISNSTITTSIKTIQAKHIMIVADSCYSGSLIRDLNIKRRTPNYFAHISRKTARVVLTSGGLEPVVDSVGNEKHSVFASVFIQALMEITSVIDGSELFSMIRRSVILKADQTPEYSDIRKAGHDGGDFIFVRKSSKSSEGVR